MSLFAFGVMAAAFGAATRSEPSEADKPQPGAPTVVIRPLPQSRFFADTLGDPSFARRQIPVEALLSEIENHIRLEQAAAESFLAAPTAALLHSKTISPLVH